MTTRRIIMLLDGTWNDADFGPSDTNIVRLRQIIADSSGASVISAPAENRAPKDPGEMVTKPVSDDRANIVFYERGVGTGTLANRLFGGAIGGGLDTNIRRAYKFLSFHYRPGDEIFIFGFSRGSYTARSLVGYIAAAGLLKRDDCNEDNERAAWDFYRTAPSDRLPGAWSDLTKHMNDRDQLRIDCLAVFDTVGALGIPLGAFVRANREQYEFHDVELSSITRVNLQAVAIDEHRWPFQATLWRKPRFKKFNTVTEQVWFSGSHADIGGGYIKEASRGDGHYLDDITLDWMSRRVKFYFPDFPIKTFRVPDNASRISVEEYYSPWISAWPNNSRTAIYNLYPLTWRSIANVEIPAADIGKREVIAGYDRHAISIGEMVHISALEKFGLQADAGARYLPKSLAAIQQRIADTYSQTSQISIPDQIPIVNWDGSILDSQKIVDKNVVTDTLARLNQRITGMA